MTTNSNLQRVLSYRDRRESLISVRADGGQEQGRSKKDCSTASSASVSERRPRRPRRKPVPPSHGIRILRNEEGVFEERKEEMIIDDVFRRTGTMGRESVGDVINNMEQSVGAEAEILPV